MVFRFSEVRENQGKGYDARSGTFTAPVSGLYFFTASLTARRSHGTDTNGVGVELFVDGHKRWRSMTTPGLTDSFMSFSLGGVEALQAGQRVWLQAKEAFNEFWINPCGDDSTVFSGFKIAS